jgi:conjugative transfer signal peptidase TraF
MIGLLVETFRPWVLIGVCIVQGFLIFAGCLVFFVAVGVHSGLGLAESLAFFVPAVLLTYARRWIVCPPAKPRPTVLLVGVAIVIAYVGTMLLLRVAGFRLNLTDSVPVGLYRETSDTSARYVGFCLPMEPLRAAQTAGLILPLGDCPGKVAPLLKPVFRASLAHPVTLTERGFLIDGKLLPNTAPKPHSWTYAPLTHTPFGRYTAGLWAISGYNPDSYDSRYFGPLDSSAIRFHATPVLTQ